VRCGLAVRGKSGWGCCTRVIWRELGCGNFYGNVDGVKFLVLAWFHSVGV